MDYKGVWVQGWSDENDDYDDRYQKYFSTIDRYDDDPLMTYFTKEYLLSYSFVFLDDTLVRHFNSFFQDRWNPIFVKWFQDKFPDKPAEIYDLGKTQIDTRES
jgi:hypothetical protein